MERATVRHALAGTSFFISTFLLFVNLSGLVLVSLSTVRASVVYVLPAHHGSTFTPIWFTFIGSIASLLSLVAFSKPTFFPRSTSALLNGLAALFSLVSLILVAAVTDLRANEGDLTLIALAVSFVTFVQATLAPGVMWKDVIAFHEEQTGYIHHVDSTAQEPFGKRLRRGCANAFNFAAFSLPIFLLHLAITLVVLLLMLNICLRALDASYVPDYSVGSTTWWVTPPQARGTNGLLDTAPRASVSYRVRLACVGEGNRTILFESRSGVPGSVEVGWVNEVARNTSARACTWDRPGYGLSDNAPSANLEHSVQALEEALEAAGEVGRTKDWILVSSGYGALVSRVFASRNHKLVSSMLFLDAQTEHTYFQPKAYRPGRQITYFFRDGASQLLLTALMLTVVSNLASPLGIARWIYIILGPDQYRSAEGRRLSTARIGLNGGILRSGFQEAYLAHTPHSISATVLKESLANFPSDRPSIVLSSSRRGHSFSDAQRSFAHDTLGRGLIRWDELNLKREEGRLCESKRGRPVCERALKDLLKL